MNYTKTKIYKIWSPKGDKIYIGSTCKDRLCQRMTGHRNKYNYYKKNNTNLITSYLLFDEYGIENCFIELIESKECSNKDEKNQLEGHYIRILECVNKNIIGRTLKEYYEDNKDKIKQYREANKESIKQYRKDNKESIKQYRTEYSELNKVKINEKRKEKILCKCGSNIRRSNKSSHEKTLKHKQLMETIDT